MALPLKEKGSDWLNYTLIKKYHRGLNFDINCLRFPDICIKIFLYGERMIERHKEKNYEIYNICKYEGWNRKNYRVL